VIAMTMRVKNVMTRTPCTIDPEASIATATAMMRDRRVRHLPVVTDAGELVVVGIVTERDVLKALAQTLPPVRGIDLDTYLW
jgi:acetoin utilization protein AcuB